MSLQVVEQAARAVAEAKEALKVACIQAVDAGIPQVKVAAAGSVHRNTIRSWVSDPDAHMSDTDGTGRSYLYRCASCDRLYDAPVSHAGLTGIMKGTETAYPKCPAVWWRQETRQ